MSDNGQDAVFYNDTTWDELNSSLYDNTTDWEYSNETDEPVAFSTIDSVLDITNYVSMAIKLLFLFTILRNWCVKQSPLKSSFFILYTLRVGMDLVDDIRDGLYKGNVVNLEALFEGADLMFIDFLLNFNVVCQLFICFNRFTAMVLPLLYSRVSVLTVFHSRQASSTALEQIWDPRGNVISISLLFLINILMAYPDFLFLVAFDVVRIFLSVISLLLVLIPILHRSKQTVTIPTHKSAEKQLLYEVSIMAAVKIIENTLYAITDSPGAEYLPDYLTVAFNYMHAVISNFFMTLDIFFLFLISTVARNGLKTAFPFLKHFNTTRTKLISAAWRS